MDWLPVFNESVKNLTALAGAVAWPTTVLGIALLFRREIAAKIASLQSWVGLGVNA